MRGVHAMGISAAEASMGSSPHVRGPLLICVSGFSLLRIIPACAGYTDNNDVFRQV